MSPSWVRWLLLAAFLRPLIEMYVLIVGHWWVRTRFRRDRSKFERLIVQITTVGTEEERVNEINRRLKEDGFDVPPPERFHGSWTFYFRAPGGGFTIEVLG